MNVTQSKEDKSATKVSELLDEREFLVYGLPKKCNPIYVKSSFARDSWIALVKEGAN